MCLFDQFTESVVSETSRNGDKNVTHGYKDSHFKPTKSKPSQIDKSSFKIQNKATAQKSLCVMMVKPMGIKLNAAAASKSETMESCQLWKAGTVLFIGDSILSDIDEKYQDRNGFVKVRSFSGSMIRGRKNYYLIPLLRKQPAKDIAPIGTNDTSCEGASSDTSLAALMDLKKNIKELVPGCEVILSTLRKRFDKMSK